MTYVVIKALTSFLFLLIFCLVPGFDVRSSLKKYPIFTIIGVSFGLFLTYVSISPIVFSLMGKRSEEDIQTKEEVQVKGDVQTTEDTQAKEEVQAKEDVQTAMGIQDKEDLQIKEDMQAKDVSDAPNTFQ